MSNEISKFLWVVSFGALTPKKFLEHALKCGAHGVCIRTTNVSFPATIAMFRTSGMKVYGWRWPAAAKSADSPPHYFALDEAHYVASDLISAGLDGYIVDPESDSPGDLNDWNHEALAPLASAFCRAIRDGASAYGVADFKFGVTSGVNYPAPTGKPHIPWGEFISASDALYPQSYWRWRRPGDNRIEDLHGGRPGTALALGQECWGRVCSGKPIFPMAGELEVITPREIADYATAALKTGNELHFYADSSNVPSSIYRAISNIRSPTILVRERVEPEPEQIPTEHIPFGPVPAETEAESTKQEETTKERIAMSAKDSERPETARAPVRPPRREAPQWLSGLYTLLKNFYWAIAALLSSIVVLQAAWPDIMSDPRSLGGVAQTISEILFDEPAAIRQSTQDQTPRNSPGFLGYIYYEGTDCRGVPAGAGTLVALPCPKNSKPDEYRFERMDIVRIKGNVEVREHPWPESQLAAIMQAGQCAEVVSNAVQIAPTPGSLPGRWLPIRRIACPS